MELSRVGSYVARVYYVWEKNSRVGRNLAGNFGGPLPLLCLSASPKDHACHWRKGTAIILCRPPSFATLLSAGVIAKDSVSFTL